MTPEGKVKKEIKAYLESLPECWHFSPMMMGYGKKGVPDIIGCHKGKFFAIEVKAPGKGGTSTPWQKMEQYAIDDAGGMIMVADDAEQVIRRFRAL